MRNLADDAAMNASYGNVMLVERRAPSRVRMHTLATRRHGWTPSQFAEWARGRTFEDA